MESPTTELEVFSSISLQEYIRLMTAAYYLQHQNQCSGVKFTISPENYAKMMEEPLKMPLIGLSLDYDATAGVLTSVPSEDFLHQYDNKIMADVVNQFYEKYKVRYASKLLLMEEDNA